MTARSVALAGTRVFVTALGLLLFLLLGGADLLLAGTCIATACLVMLALLALTVVGGIVGLAASIADGRKPRQ